MKDNYFIIHGSFSSPCSNWFNWLADFIISEGKTVYVRYKSIFWTLISKKIESNKYQFYL